MRLNIIICSLVVFFSGFSQNIDNQQKIKSSIQNYFYYDRENIHVQFNKSIYVNNEDLAFKGYVFSKNNSLPHLNTTNVQLVVYNEQNEVVQKQLLYTTFGTFEGGLHLNDKFTSGTYTFQFYTNWMNNFNEDESFTQTIEVISKTEPYYIKSIQPNWETAKVSFFPESGIIINGIINAVGVKITDCNQKGIAITDGVVLDSNSNEVTHFKTNAMGNGNFYFIPMANQTYTLKINSDQLKITQQLPETQNTGIAISYNNNLPNNILAVAIKTNDIGVALYQNKNYILLIHQDGNSIQKEFTFNAKDQEQIIGFDKKYLSNGVNSIRVIDENLNEVAERLVYIYQAPKVITTIEAKTIANDSVVLLGKTEANQANISISVLPENTVCAGHKNSILGTFYLNAYLEQPEKDSYFYYDPENSTRKQDMELLMLNQNRSKYLWSDIIAQPPKITFPFTKGVTISGKVEKFISPKSKFKISLISVNDKVFDEEIVDKNGDYKFEHFFAQDSTVFLLQLLNEKNMSIFAKMTARVIPTESRFKFALNGAKANCPPQKNEEDKFTFATPKNESFLVADKSIINLAEVNIQSKTKKDPFTHKGDVNSIMASAFKIGDDEFGNVMDFIGRNGYRTGINDDDNTAFIRNPRNAVFSENGAPPSVYIDNEVVFDLNLLYSLYLSDVDEIYIDKTGFSGMGGSSGNIKIFLKKGVKTDFYRTKYTSLIVTKGFAKNIDYKNSQFETQKEFYSFGTLNWTSKVLIKENQNYEIAFPKGNQTAIQVLIEGFTADGQLISEIKKIPVLKSM